MFWKKRFKTNESDIKAIVAELEALRTLAGEESIYNLNTRQLLFDAVKETNDLCVSRLKEERKFTESVRNGLNKRVTDTLGTQAQVNENVIELIEQLQDENETQKAQITALIESHHNRAMYNGSLKAAKKS